MSSWMVIFHTEEGLNYQLNLLLPSVTHHQRLFSLFILFHVKWISWKQSQVVRKPANSNPVLKGNQIIAVSSKGGGGNKGVKLPSPYFLSQFLPPPYFFEPISPSSLNGYVSFSPSSLLFPPISPSSQLFWAISPSSLFCSSPLSSLQMFFLFRAFVLSIGSVIIKFKIEGQTIHRKPHHKLKSKFNLILG